MNTLKGNSTKWMELAGVIKINFTIIHIILKLRIQILILFILIFLEKLVNKKKWNYFISLWTKVEKR